MLVARGVAHGAEVGGARRLRIENTDDHFAEIEIERGIQAFAAVAIAADDVQRRPGFSDEHCFGINRFDVLGELRPVIDRRLRIGLLGQRAVFNRIAHRVEAEAVHAFLQPEAGKLVHCRNHVRIA